MTRVAATLGHNTTTKWQNDDQQSRSFRLQAERTEAEEQR
jgi:hypothetical protein